MKGFYIVTKKTNYSLWHQAVTLFTEISKSLIKGKKETTTQKRRYNVHLVSDIDRFSLREPSLAVVGEPVTLNALIMSTINQNCQSKLHASLDVHLCIRRIHHWHLIFFFWVHSSYADLTAKNINDSSNTQLAELRNSVRNSDVPPMKKGAWNITMN